MKSDDTSIIKQVRVCRHGAGTGGALHTVVLGIYRLIHDEERYQHRHGGDGETTTYNIGHQRYRDISVLLRNAEHIVHQQHTDQTWGNIIVDIRETAYRANSCVAWRRVDILLIAKSRSRGIP